MQYTRKINLLDPLKSRSLFLFGPRQTGKSTLLSHLWPDARTYNLLASDTFQELSANPSLIRQQLQLEDKIIIIDEVQKLPSLLDEAHLLIERNKELLFILTGSSARKLKRGGANLLAGRAWVRTLHPLVSCEVGPERLMARLNRGSLPMVLDSPDAYEDLKAYVGTYLKEEISAEGLVRSIENFSRFLLVAGLANGTQINLENLGQDAGISPRTIREYFHILSDTLVGFFVEPYTKSIKRKSVGIAKFYLFDVGVANFLMKRGEVLPGSKSFGEALEHQVAIELSSYLAYENIDVPLQYWRSTTKFEVDFTVEDHVAIEVKGKAQVPDHDLKGIRALMEEKIFKRHLVVTCEKAPRKTDDGIELIPVELFFQDLWNGKVIEIKRRVM